MDEASCSVRRPLLLLMDTFPGGFPQGGHISAEDCDQEDASRVRRNIDVVPELWCCISVSCIWSQRNAMRDISAANGKGAWGTVAFSSCVDLALTSTIRHFRASTTWDESTTGIR